MSLYKKPASMRLHYVGCKSTLWVVMSTLVVLTIFSTIKFLFTGLQAATSRRQPNHRARIKRLLGNLGQMGILWPQYLCCSLSA